MKRLLLIAAAMLALLTMIGCAAIRDAKAKDDHPYEKPFYAKYLNTGSTLDANITRTLDALRVNPDSPELHNALGTLLVEKGFPKDAEREFERAVNLDKRFFPAWYNLGLVRASRGDELGARRAYARTVDLKPGHSAALFQLGLVEEKNDHIERAVKLYAKAYGINPALLDVRVNPRIIESKLTHLALLELYPREHARRSMAFQGSPLPVRDNSAPAADAPSPQPTPEKIVTPAPPTTSPVVQPPTPAPTNVTPVPPATRRRRPPSAPQSLPPPEPTPEPPAVEPYVQPNATGSFGQPG